MEMKSKKNGLKGHRLLAILVIAALIVACMVPIGSFAGEPDYKVLFTNGTDETSVGIYATDTTADADGDDIDDETGEEMLKGYLQADAIPDLVEGWKWQDRNDATQLYSMDDLLDIYIEKDMDFVAVDPKAIVDNNTVAVQSTDGKQSLAEDDEELGDYVKTNISWSRTPENNAVILTRGEMFDWKWEDEKVQSLSNGMITGNSNIWDAANTEDIKVSGSDSHYYTGYLPNKARTAWNAATWKFHGGTDYNKVDMRLFRGKFSLNSGIDSVGNFKLNTVTNENKIQINDNMFVFIYPDSKDFEMTNANYLDQLAFWATGSDAPHNGSDGPSTYKGKFGDVDNNTTYRVDKYRQQYSGKYKFLTDEVLTGGEDGLYLSDGIYLPVSENNIGTPIKVASGYKNYKNWIIDIYVQDVYGGGGMDQLYISMEDNGDPSVMIKYWLADEEGNLTEANVGGQSYYEVPEITSDDIGKSYTVASGNGDGQLDKYKPASGYSSGVQVNPEYKITTGNNIIDVVYSPATASVKYNNVQFKTSNGGSLVGDNQSGQFISGTAWADTLWNNFGNIPVPTADEGYEFKGWQKEDDSFVTKLNERQYEWPTNINKDYVFTAIFEKIEDDFVVTVDEDPGTALDSSSANPAATSATNSGTSGVAAAVENVLQVLGDIAAPLSSGDSGNDVTIKDNKIAQSSGGGAAWALLNLILTILTGAIALALVITFFTKRRENEDEESKQERINADGSGEEPKVKKKPVLRVLSIVMTILAVVLFVLTEDMTLPMIFTDNYTIYHLVMFVITVLLATFSIKKYEDAEDEETPEMA